MEYGPPDVIVFTDDSPHTIVLTLQTIARNVSVCICNSQDGSVIQKLDNTNAGMTACTIVCV